MDKEWIVDEILKRNRENMTLLLNGEWELDRLKRETPMVLIALYGALMYEFVVLLEAVAAAKNKTTAQLWSEFLLETAADD